MKAQRMLTKVLLTALFLVLSLPFLAYAQVNLVSPGDGEIFGPCSMIDSYQPSFKWSSDETFKSFTIQFSTSSTDFEAGKILSAQVSGTKFKWKPEITSWLKIMKKSYNFGDVRDIYWKVTGKKPDDARIESEVWSFQVGPTQPVILNSPVDGQRLDSAIAPTFSFTVNCNVKFMLEFSLLANFSDPAQIWGFPSSRKDPNAKPVKNQTLTWDQWTLVKKKLGTQGYFRVKAWDSINRETISEVRSIEIYYFLVGSWDVRGTETITVVVDGESAIETLSVYDLFTFYLQGRRFEMVGLTQGKWQELPNYEYAILFPYSYIAAFFEDELEWMLGTDVEVAVTGFSMGGRENRVSDRINGTMILNMWINFPYYGMSGTVSAYLTYRGSRLYGTDSIARPEVSETPLVSETIGKKLKELLPGH